MTFSMEIGIIIKILITNLKDFVHGLKLMGENYFLQWDEKHTICQLHHKMRVLWSKSKKSIGIFFFRNVTFAEQFHSKAFSVKSKGISQLCLVSRD